ncbi:hypothetical protein CBS76997_3566 [Aspergillus niger]|nr:hypothetical protein CBS147371_1716 [Aspergillus niger]KAI2957547.1 hypothetical protein CBS147322_2155 [Aspergillus niger]KAI2993179.1 hypothetical protein CBS147344_47 [Aspergillus niger]KAI3047463.1 hypothetical protein CBS76997_3566 [Aspergillus niger]
MPQKGPRETAPVAAAESAPRPNQQLRRRDQLDPFRSPRNGELRLNIFVRATLSRTAGTIFCTLLHPRIPFLPV